MITGPRIASTELPEAPGLEKRAYVHDLFEHLACADAAIVQGGLSTTMELVARAPPSAYVPPRKHWEQQAYVSHRLRHYGRVGGRSSRARLEAAQAGPAPVRAFDRTTEPRRIHNPRRRHGARVQQSGREGVPMDLVRVYDVHTKARQRLFDWVRPLSQEQYTRLFPFGHRTLRGTLVEIARAELFLAMRMREEVLPAWEDWPIAEERLPTFPDLETVCAAQATRTRATLADTKDWDRAVPTRIVRGDKVFILTATKADIAMQLLLHEVHHRAQAMAMLRQLGVEAQDLDYIGFVQTRQEQARPSQ